MAPPGAGDTLFMPPTPQGVQHQNEGATLARLAQARALLLPAAAARDAR